MYFCIIMRSKYILVTEISHEIHEFFYMLKHYRWNRIGCKPNVQMLVYMADNPQSFYLGGMADRFKAMISTYAWCKQRGIDFRIRHVFPYELADYLDQAQYDWRLKDGEYTDSIWNSRLMRARGEHGRRLVRKKYKGKQIHFYGNRDFLYYINETGNTNYTWGELFQELFKPGKELKGIVHKKKEEIGSPYISAVFRFQNLLGDFKEYGYQSIDDTEKRNQLISKCINGLLELQKRTQNKHILVTSDSSAFINIVSQIPGVHVIKGERVHIGCDSSANFDTYLKSFVDFYMLVDSEKIYCLGTAEMYPSQFPEYAAKVRNIAFERVLLK